MATGYNRFSIFGEITVTYFRKFAGPVAGHALVYLFLMKINDIAGKGSSPGFTNRMAPSQSLAVTRRFLL